MALIPVSVQAIGVGPDDQELYRADPISAAVIEVDDEHLGTRIRWETVGLGTFDVDLPLTPTDPIVLHVRVPLSPSRVMEHADGRISRVWDMPSRIQTSRLLLFQDGTTKTVKSLL